MSYYNDGIAGEDSPLVLFDEKRNKKLAYQRIHTYLYESGIYDAYLDDPNFDVLGDSTNRLIEYLLNGGYDYHQISQIKGCKNLIDNWIKSDIFRLKSTYSMNYAKTKSKGSVIKTSSMLVTKFKELPPEIQRAIIIGLSILGILIASYKDEPYDISNPLGTKNNSNNPQYTYSEVYDQNSSGRHK